MSDTSTGKHSLSVHVDPHPAGLGWNVSSLEYPLDGDGEPNDGDCNAEFDRKRDAVSYAKKWCRDSVKDGSAANATVLVDGNEVACYHFKPGVSYVWEIQGRWALGWEMESTYASRLEALPDLRAYRNNQPEVSHRLIRVRSK